MLVLSKPAALLGLLFAGASGLPGAAPAAITVDVAPVKVERRTFDPRNPPAEMPKLTPPEVGTCVYQFACSTEAQAEGSRSRFGREPARITEVMLRASLSVTIWTPRGGPPKILAHEEAHREICEYYYAQAEQIGRRVAQSLIGRPLQGRTTRAMETELDQLQKPVIREFLRQTADRCDVAQAHFDAITQHSMSAIAEDVAIVRAIAAEQTHYAQLQRGGQRERAGPAGTGSATATGRYPPTRPKRP